jgi:pimeloyl-ACP methyl ester carboxylesterase
VSATPTSAGAERRVGDRSTVPGLPEALFVAERPPAGGWGGAQGPVVVLVHGSLDRAASFGRVARRLEDLALVTYDRRGYQGSRDAAVSDDLRVHVDDLVRIAAAYAEHRSACAGVVAVGHSVGATIVLGAAARAPDLLRAVGAYEPSMPWLGFHREGTPGSRANRDRAADPGLEAERFFRRMVGDAAWQRLPEEERAGRRADGPALLADLRAIRRGAPFDVTSVSVPVIVSSGGPSSFPHHRDTSDWLAAHVPTVRRSTIPDAAHGAHLSHPDAFAELVHEVVALSTRAPDHD